jgi:hypothetical protein
MLTRKFLPKTYRELADFVRQSDEVERCLRCGVSRCKSETQQSGKACGGAVPCERCGADLATACKGARGA